MHGERRPPPDLHHGGGRCTPHTDRQAAKRGGRRRQKRCGADSGCRRCPPQPAPNIQGCRCGSPPPLGGGLEVEEDEPHSPIQPRNLLGADSGDTASEDTSSTDSEHDSNDAAPGVEIDISAEGSADDTYMLTIRLLSLLAMLVATSKWLKLTGQEVNAKKSLAFSATNKARRKPEAPEATLDGVRMPVRQEFRQMGVGVRTMPRRGTGPLLQRRIGEAKQAMKKTCTIPGGFDRKGEYQTRCARGACAAGTGVVP